MAAPDAYPQALRTARPFDIAGARERLAAGAGGYEVVHHSAGLEIGVYVLVAPEPDKQRPHEDDEVYVVLEGRGTLEVGEEPVELREGTQSSCRPAPSTASWGMSSSASW